MSDYDMDSDVDFEDEFDYNGDHFNSGFCAPGIPARWRFLRDFIELVGGRYTPQTPRRLHSIDGSVRLGRDPSDWWINVQFENGALVSKYDELADDRVARYRTVREATLLLGVLARVDYVAFLALLVRRGKFDVPKYMDLETHALPCQFNFFFCRDLEAKEYAWTLLQDVLGDRHYSQEFLEHDR